MGLVAALSSFIPNLSELSHPLNESSSSKLKEVVTSETVLIHYYPAKKLDLAVDASQYGLGAVIMHTCPDGKRRPIAFASRSLNKHEKGYSQIDKEALAIMFGLKHFCTCMDDILPYGLTINLCKEYLGPDMLFQS